MRRMASVVLGFFHASSIVLPFEHLVSVFDLESSHLHICFICFSLYKYVYRFISPYSNRWTLTKCHFPLERLELRPLEREATDQCHV